MARQTVEAVFTLPGLTYSIEVYGPVDETRLEQELREAVDLFEQAIDEGGLVAGDVEGHLSMLVATAYALGLAANR